MTCPKCQKEMIQKNGNDISIVDSTDYPMQQSITINEYFECEECEISCFIVNQ